MAASVLPGNGSWSFNQHRNTNIYDALGLVIESCRLGARTRHRSGLSLQLIVRTDSGLQIQPLVMLCTGGTAASAPSVPSAPCPYVMPSFEAMDQNRDGVISRAEYQNATAGAMGFWVYALGSARIH